MAITFHHCCFLVVFSLLGFGACNNGFQEVKSCPANEEEWKHRAQIKSCQAPNRVFMCAAISKHLRKFGEHCVIMELAFAGNLKHSCVVIYVVLSTCILCMCFCLSIRVVYIKNHYWIQRDQNNAMITNWFIYVLKRVLLFKNLLLIKD